MALDVFEPNLAVFTPTTDDVLTHAPTRPMDVLPEVRQTLRAHCTICSIYPQSQRKQIRHNGMTVYSIPAAPRGEYRLLRVYDTQEWCNRIDPTDGRPGWMPMPIPASIVAQDLVATWAGDTLGKRSGFSPGIAIIQGDKPTEEELSTLRTSQSAYFDWFIKDAWAKHMKGLGTEITDTHRMAAKEMLDKGAERLPWYPTVQFAAVKDCVACGQQIEAKSKVCDKCGTNIVDWYVKYSLDTDDDPVIKEFMSKIKPSKREKEPASA